MLTYKDILDLTTSYYIENPERRGINEDNKCQYCTDDNRVCAVGFWALIPKELEYRSGGEGIDELIDSHFPLTDYLKPEVSFAEMEFWKDLQSWHDARVYWHSDMNGTVLSEEGKEYLQKLYDKWSNTD